MSHQTLQGFDLLLVIKDELGAYLDEFSRVPSLLKFTGFGCDGAANMLGNFDSQTGMEPEKNWTAKGEGGRQIN